jgi:hypothetical protein
MTNVEPRMRSPDRPARYRRQYLASAVERLTSAIDVARSSARTVIGHVPGTVRATRARAHNTTSALQTLPDTTLRWLAASSVGLGAGFYLARAPRLVIAAGVAPALVMGAAIVLRPIPPDGVATEHRDGSTGGTVR